MKKLLCIVIAGVMAVAFTACATEETPDATSDTEETVSSTDTQTEEEDTKSEEETTKDTVSEETEPENTDEDEDDTQTGLGATYETDGFSINVADGWVVDDSWGVAYLSPPSEDAVLMIISAPLEELMESIQLDLDKYNLGDIDLDNLNVDDISGILQSLLAENTLSEDEATVSGEVCAVNGYNAFKIEVVSLVDEQGGYALSYIVFDDGKFAMVVLSANDDGHNGDVEKMLETFEFN